MTDGMPAAKAARNRWVLPDDGIIDPVAVEIAASGRRVVRLTRAERRAAAARILAAGGDAGTIARRLRMQYASARALAAGVTETGEAAGARS